MQVLVHIPEDEEELEGGGLGLQALDIWFQRSIWLVDENAKVLHLSEAYSRSAGGHSRAAYVDPPQEGLQE